MIRGARSSGGGSQSTLASAAADSSAALKSCLTAGGPMVSHVSRDRLTSWKQLVKAEVQSGEIPLPIVESIVIDEDRPPTIVLLADNVVPGATDVFVATETLPDVTRATLDALLLALEQVARTSDVLSSRLQAVYHEGTLAYELHWESAKGTVPATS